MVAEEIAAILPIPTAVIDDAGFPIWAEVRPAGRGSRAGARSAVFAGTEKPASWPEVIVPGAIAAGNTVSADDEGKILLNLA